MQMLLIYLKCCLSYDSFGQQMSSSGRVSPSEFRTVNHGSIDSKIQNWFLQLRM